MSTNEPFVVSDQAIIDAILDYTRRHSESCPVAYDPSASEAERLGQEMRIVRWFQDTRHVVDFVCQRPGFSGLNVLKLAVQAMEAEVIAQAGTSPHTPNLTCKE